MEPKGLILHLQRLSTEDGPGIRTTVFFKGCPLRCRWCHNPESLYFHPQVQWFSDRCIGCDACLAACPNKNLHKTAEGIVIDRQNCRNCGQCALVCPSGALELSGIWTGVDELVKELVKDRAFYQASGGGVTLSGGEPTLQSNFTERLLAALKSAGIHTALDTCGLCNRPVFERLLSQADLLLFDLKLFDPALHRFYTGQDNGIILENLSWAASRLAAGESEVEIWVRTPLIPGATTFEANIAAVGSFLSGLDGRITRWELCAFNNLCREKYRRLGMVWEYRDAPRLSLDTLQQVEAWAKSSGVDPRIVFVTGNAQE